MTTQEFEDLVEFLSETPAALKRLVDGLNDRELRWKPSAEEFSALEQAWHLRDIEREGYAVRIAKLLEESEPFLKDLDGGALARERNYNTLEIDPALETFARAREDNLRKLKGLPMADLNRRGTFENAGTITLERLLLMMSEHDQSHRQELKELRERIGRNTEYRRQNAE